MKKVVGIYGASGFGRDVLPLLREQLCLNNQDFDLLFVDDSPPAEIINGTCCLTYKQFLAYESDNKQIAIAVANSVVREKLAEQCEVDRIKFIGVRASNAIELDNVQIGEGAIICPFVTLTSNIKIGKHFHANIYSYVEHDCIIGDFVTFAPRVACNGNVIIGDHVYVGTGAIIRQGNNEQPLIIGRGAVIGMGAVVTKNVPAGATVVGNPARLLIKR
ncbi:MAG: acetyltransferase [Deltaproteobacteria bacterium]